MATNSSTPLSSTIINTDTISLPPMPAIDTPSRSLDSSEGSSLPLSKWQLALLLGVPVVAVGAYLYIRSRQETEVSKKKGVSGAKKASSEVKNGRQSPTPSSSGYSSTSSSASKSAKRPTASVAPSKQDKKPSTPFDEAMELKSKGNEFFKQGKYQDAVYFYTKAIRLCPLDKRQELATFYQNRAAAYEMMKDMENVIKDCSEALKFNKKYEKALHRRLKAYEACDKLEEALNDATALCILQGFGQEPALMATDRILKKHSKRKAAEFIKTRTPTLPSKHFIRHYFMSFSRDPLITDPKSIDGEALENMLTNSDNHVNENGEGKISTLKQLLLRSTIKILKGDVKGAEEDLQTLLKSEEETDEKLPNDIYVNALVKLGTIKMQGSEDEPLMVKEALECFAQAEKRDENNPDIFLHRAQIHLLNDRAEEAKKDLDKCCRLSENFASAIAQKLYVQFRCAARLQDIPEAEEAIQEFQRAISKFPSSSEVYSLYAQTLMEQRRFDESDEYFSKAIGLDPEDANLHVHRAILYLQWQDDVDKAVSMLEKALKIDPKCQFAYEMLGSIQVQRGNLTQGIDYFKQALKGAQTEMDMAHIYQLHDAACAQLQAAQLLGVELPSMPS